MDILKPVNNDFPKCPRCGEHFATVRTQLSPDRCNVRIEAECDCGGKLNQVRPVAPPGAGILSSLANRGSL